MPDRKVNQSYIIPSTSPVKSNTEQCIPKQGSILVIDGLIHWGRDKMAAISQTTFSNAFSWMKKYEFQS